MRRKLLGSIVLVAVFVMPAAAWAKSPSGSSEAKNRHVKCKGGQATPAGNVFVGTTGAEVCSGDNQAPDGRVIVSAEGYAAVDGDPTNGDQADGFVRIDRNGPTCGDDKKYDASKGPGGSCQPAPPFGLPIP